MAPSATTREAVLGDLKRRFAHAGLADPARSARRILELGAGLALSDLVARPEAEIGSHALDRMEALAARHIAGEPISRLAGVREFWGLAFCLGADTLDPRPDSETLVEAALELLRDVASPRVLDLGTGTGCLLLALLHERTDASGVGVDCAAGAVDTAQANAAALGLSDRAVFRVGDWDQGLEERFDLVISNPPYIVSEEIEGLSAVVRDHDPRRALDGGHDGLDAYRALAALAPERLAEDGTLILELGQGQADAVAGLLTAVGFDEFAMRADLAGISRALIARRRKKKVWKSGLESLG